MGFAAALRSPDFRRVCVFSMQLGRQRCNHASTQLHHTRVQLSQICSSIHHRTGSAHTSIAPSNVKLASAAESMQEATANASICVPELRSKAETFPSESSSQTPHTTSSHVSSPGQSKTAPSGSWLAKLQQNLNVKGIGLFLGILGGNKSLAIPHLSVKDISHINWQALHKAGFKAVVFDKDNTLTRPFVTQVEPHLLNSLEQCKAAFGASGIALYSNSAGLQQYDPQGKEASELEAALGIAVMRHKQKKPAGDAAEVAEHFRCQSHELIMVGDRYLTDVVFGNRHGMLTIRPEPLTHEGEPAGVRMARAIEEYCVASWGRAGIQAPGHPLMSANSIRELYCARQQR